MSTNPIPSAPNVEQPVPQEVRSLVETLATDTLYRGVHIGERSRDQAAALILAAMERFAEQKLQQSRKFWEDSTRDALRDKDQQLAALQRENAELKGKS